MKLLRLLRERWPYWLIPLLITLGLGYLLAVTRPEPEPEMPMSYDLPTDS